MAGPFRRLERIVSMHGPEDGVAQRGCFASVSFSWRFYSFFLVDRLRDTKNNQVFIASRYAI
jgi:hypothetical protein